MYFKESVGHHIIALIKGFRMIIDKDNVTDHIRSACLTKLNKVGKGEEGRTMTALGLEKQTFLISHKLATYVFQGKLLSSSYSSI